jgi:hypothetical protein
VDDENGISGQEVSLECTQEIKIINSTG